MLQLFHADVVKADRDVAHVAIVVHVATVVHVCYKLLFPMFYLFFHTYMLQVCLSGYCIRFTHMLQVFYLDIAYVLQCFSCVFPGAFASVFRSMFEVFYLSLDVCCKCCILMFQK
jgi:hypothetical protein